MSIRVTCGKCGVVLKVKEDLAGTKGKCPACKGTLNVPTLEEAAQAAAAASPLGATETAAAATAGDTGAIKVPTTKAKSAKVAAAPEEGTPPPPPEVNGSAAAHPPAAEAVPSKARKPAAEAPAKAAESTTDDLEERAETPAKPLKAKPRLTMDDSDDASAPPPAPSVERPQPAEAAKPAAEAPAPPPPAKETPAPKASKGDGDFDLDSFLMEGPKPKSLPPVPEEGAAKKGAPPPRGSGRKLSMSDDETNVSGPSETLPPPNRRGSAAESAMSALTGGGTSSSAKDLLAKASQEGRARASSMPDEQRERLDIAGALKTIFQQYGLQVGGTIVLCAVLYFGMDYMMSTGRDLPPLARVYGRVTVKKQPVEGVVVTFTPVGSKDSKDSGSKVKKGRVRDSTGMTDKDGHYELMYEEGIRGAVVGQNRVWIDPFTPENYKKIPGSWTTAGTSEIREVKATGGEENIDIP